MDFNYDIPVNLVFGRGKIKLLGEIVSQYGKKAIIVTGTGSTKKSGLLDKSVELLAKQGIESVIFDKVQQNPLTTTAIDGATFAKDNNCDVVVGIGGGSIMDCAKAIGFLSLNNGDINDYIFGKIKSDKALPIILVPTTCGTGSEGNGLAVLTNPENGDKKSLRTNVIIAKASIIDSSLMETMPKSILASVGFDALCHNMEAYLSNSLQPLTEILALKGMKLVAESLVSLYKGEVTDELWDKLTLGSTLGGMCIYTSGVALAHGMEHPASGLRDIVHGKGLASLTPIIMEKTVEFAKDKCTEISKCLGGNDYTDCVDKIKQLLSDIDLKITLSQQGITENDIPWMTENFFKISLPGYNNHPVKFTSEEISNIFKLAL